MTSGPQLFFASVTQHDGILCPIREAVIRLGSEYNNIKFAENIPGLQNIGEKLNKIEIALKCISAIGNCDIFIAVISKSFGSDIIIENDTKISTSFFEIELFVAALLGKPAYIYIEDGVKTNARLEHLTQVLRASFPHFRRQPKPQKAIVEEIERLASASLRNRAMNWIQRIPSVSILCDFLQQSRHNSYLPEEDTPKSRFLDGEDFSSTKSTDLYAADSLIDFAEKQGNYYEKLSCYWMSLRELGINRPNLSLSSDGFVIARRALLGWYGAGAWFGLHCHAAMGCLPALGSLSALARQRDEPEEVPHGPLASSYYSLSKHTRRKEFQDYALKHIDIAIQQGPGENHYNHACRASILLAMGHVDAAVVTYKHVVSARADSDKALLGEALNELGFALFRSGERTSGIDHMELGLELLRNSARPGFEIRAMRKLAVAKIRNGIGLSFSKLPEVSKGLDIYNKAQKMAIDTGAFDQCRNRQNFFMAVRTLMMALR
jgi:nucleoside 2-deoxyribosyltransferase